MSDPPKAGPGVMGAGWRNVQSNDVRGYAVRARRDVERLDADRAAQHGERRAMGLGAGYLGRRESLRAHRHTTEVAESEEPRLNLRRCLDGLGADEVVGGDVALAEPGRDGQLEDLVERRGGGSQVLDRPLHRVGAIDRSRVRPTAQATETAFVTEPHRHDGGIRHRMEDLVRSPATPQAPSVRWTRRRWLRATARSGQ